MTREGSVHAPRHPPPPASRSPGWLRPPSRQYLEALGRRVAADDLQFDVRLILRPFDKATHVAAIGVCALHEWVPLARALQDALAAVAVPRVKPEGRLWMSAP